MKINKIDDPLTDEREEVNFQDSQLVNIKRIVKMHLLIVAIDPATPMGVKSVTLHFPNREEGLQAFNSLAAIARNVLKTCVEDTRLYQTIKT